MLFIFYHITNLKRSAKAKLFISIIGYFSKTACYAARNYCINNIRNLCNFKTTVFSNIKIFLYFTSVFETSAVSETLGTYKLQKVTIPLITLLSVIFKCIEYTNETLKLVLMFNVWISNN
jgi:hypothetical protein